MANRKLVNSEDDYEIVKQARERLCRRAREYSLYHDREYSDLFRMSHILEAAALQYCDAVAGYIPPEEYSKSVDHRVERLSLVGVTRESDTTKFPAKHSFCRHSDRNTRRQPRSKS